MEKKRTNSGPLREPAAKHSIYTRQKCFKLLISQEVRALIRNMWRSNPTWGSPRMVGELRKLGINVAKSTVEKYRPRVRKPSSPTWKTFLTNHAEDLIACDFFSRPNCHLPRALRLH